MNKNRISGIRSLGLAAVLGLAGCASNRPASQKEGSSPVDSALSQISAIYPGRQDDVYQEAIYSERNSGISEEAIRLIADTHSCTLPEATDYAQSQARFYNLLARGSQTRGFLDFDSIANHTAELDMALMDLYETHKKIDPSPETAEAYKRIYLKTILGTTPEEMQTLLSHNFTPEEAQTMIKEFNNKFD